MLNEPCDLTGKVVLVVGGRGYVGRHCCAAMRRQGASVHAADIAEASTAARAQGDVAQDERIRQWDVDVTEPGSVDALVNNVLESDGRVDVLVYAATAKPADFYKPYPDCSLDGWRTLLQVELDGLFLVTQRVAPVMQEAGGGSIICMGSIYGVVGNDQRIYEDSNLASLYGEERGEKPKRVYSHAGYAAAKGAAVAMTRYLAAYYGQDGIRVNCISPGGIEHAGENEAFVQRYAERTPLRRKARLDEVSGAVLYLASDAAGYVSGHNLVVDGGWTAW